MPSIDESLAISRRFVTATPYWNLASCQSENNITTPATIPQKDSNPVARAVAVAVRRAGFMYRPSLISEAAFFLNSTLGNTRVQADLVVWTTDRVIIDRDIEADVNSIKAVIVVVSVSAFKLVDYPPSYITYRFPIIFAYLIYLE